MNQFWLVQITVTAEQRLLLSPRAASIDFGSFLNFEPFLEIISYSNTATRDYVMSHAWRQKVHDLWTFSW